MNGSIGESLRKWVAWASGRINERLAGAQRYLEMDCRTLAEEELLAGQAMLELMRGFQVFVLEGGQERAGPEDS
jgi:hypothetical protein